LLLGGSGERATRYVIQGRGLSLLPPGEETTPIYSLNHARSRSDKHAALTSPLIGSTSALRASSILPSALADFHEVSRAARSYRTSMKMGVRQAQNAHCRCRLSSEPSQ